MYEDWAAGRITEYNFNMLSGKYQSEQAELGDDMMKVRNLGRKSLEEVLAKLKELGLQLQPTEEDVYKRQHLYGKLRLHSFKK